MARKRYQPEEIVAKLRQVDVLLSQGQNIVDAIRQIGVSEVTYYRWRQEFGGLKTEQVKRLKDLELENSRLRKAVSDLTLDKLILQEGRPGKRTNKKPTANIRRSCSDSSVTASQMDGVFGSDKVCSQPQSRCAVPAMLSSTGCTSEGEREMTLSTSLIAV